jgi:mannosidase alpha-like ER degradation enhancer 1
VRPGQQVFVTDQKMEGYLPIPANPPATLHAPPEVLLRFSTISSKGERAVFLHAAASTATFGKSFGSAGSAGFGIGGLGMLIRPKVNVDGCRAFKPGEIPEVRGVLVLDRGECPFLTKTLHAKMAGMDGVLLVGLAPTPPELLVQDPSTPGVAAGSGSGSQTEGLIRPSADGEPEELLHRVSELGVVYVEHIVGQVVLRMMDVERKAVAVEMMLLEAEPAREDLKPGGGGDGRDKAREGRVMVNDWEIWNLRVRERPP